MDEYIKRKEAILTVRGYAKHSIDKGRKSLDTVDDAIHMCDEIDRLPAADVVPVVHGRWLHSGCEEYSGLEVVKCSECNHEAFAIAFYVCNGNYCPSRGARMDGGAE